MQGIYMIKNKINNKMYVGSSIHMKERWRQHISALKRNSHKSKHLQNSFNKYGIDNFEFIVLEEIEDSDKLLEVEQYYLDFYKSYERNNGYNMNKSAERGRLGRKHSDETKEKISRHFKGRKLSKKHRDNIVKSLYGREKTKETREKIGKKNRKFNDAEIDEIINLYKQGNNYQEIADKMGCVKTTIYNIFKKLFSEGVVIKRSEYIKSKVLELLVNTDMTQKEIATQLNISEGSITRIKKLEESQ